MKIAIIYSTFYVRGGAENIILWLTAELLKRGHQVTIFTSEYDKDDLDIPESVRKCFVEVYAGGNYSTWIDWMVAGWRLRKRLQKFDIVNPHNFPANVWVYFAKRFSRGSFPKIIWYCQEPSRLLYAQEQSRKEIQIWEYDSISRHVMTKFHREGWSIGAKLFQKAMFYSLTFLLGNSLKRLHRYLDKQAGEICELILANSNYMASQIQRIYAGKGTTCYLGVPVSKNQSAESQFQKKNYFLTVTRLERLKHVDSIIQALHLLAQQENSDTVSLLIIGKGSQERALKELVSTLELEEYVTFLGYVSDDDVHHHYSEALAVIYVPEDEPFGLVPLEAMFRKTAVIVSNEGGMLETVVNNVTGFYVEPENIEQIANAMLKLLHDKERAVKMGEHGFQRMMQHFTFLHFVDRFEQHLIQ